MAAPAQQPKRVRFQTANGSTAEKSALAADDTTVTSDNGSDSDSELSESSEEPSDESSSEDDDDEDEDAMLDAGPEKQQASNGVTNLRAGQGKKPIMKLNKKEMGPDIRTFLKDFLPQLKAANDELMAQKKAGTLKSREIDMTDADEAEEYIEMVSAARQHGLTPKLTTAQDLGLGVLEEKDPSALKRSLDDDSDSDEDMEDAEADVLGKLMGRPATKEPVVIQEVQDAQAS
jgi:hypothetical protein